MRGIDRSSIDAFLPFLDKPFKWDDIQQLIQLILKRLVCSPVPLPLIASAAERCEFAGKPLIDRAAAVSADLRAAGTLFEPSGECVDRNELCGTAVVPPPQDLGCEESGGGTESTEESAVPSLEYVFERIFVRLGEERPWQLEMARAVMDSLENDGISLIEAGTGTGKSLAYLVPAVLFACGSGERVIVSTYTRNLQDQLLNREVRLLLEILNLQIPVERLVGRENYFCSGRLVAAVASALEEQPADALALALSASLADEGLIDALSRSAESFSATDLAAPARCSMRGCGHADRCPLVRARERARGAMILFVNHALMMTDFRQGGTILGPSCRVIFDEAHHLERCVMENMSVKVSRDDLDRILDPIRPGSRGDERWKYLEAELEGAGRPSGRGDLREKVRLASTSLSEEFREFFGAASASLNPGRGLGKRRIRFTDGGETFAECRVNIKDILFHINELVNILKPLLEISVTEQSLLFQQELSTACDSLGELAESIKYLTVAEDEDTVFWLEWTAGGFLLEVRGSPLCVDRIFADCLGEFCASAVLTSATISECGSFAHIKDTLGLGHGGRRPRELIVPSPFRHEERCLALLLTGLGDPNDEGFARGVGEVVMKLARELERRVMVLFTSYRLCHSTARYLENEGFEREILVQGEGMGREELSRRFRLSKGGVLLGVASFWEGVDFPGEELEVLIIPKIPFPVPTEPIVEARTQRLRALGEEPFERLFIPEAVLRLRQGVGRLMRRGDDLGIVVVLDSRLDSRPYGEHIASAVPSTLVKTDSVDGLVLLAKKWFGRF